MTDVKLAAVKEAGRMRWPRARIIEKDGTVSVYVHVRRPPDKSGPGTINVSGTRRVNGHTVQVGTFTVDGHEFTFSGRCPTCSGRQLSSAKPERLLANV